MSDFSPDVIEAMKGAGVDPSSLDDGSLDPSAFTEVEAEAKEAEAATEGEVAEVPEGEEIAAEEGSEAAAEVKPEEEEKKEAPVEEPKLTLKEFQEIQAAKEELAKKEQSFMEQMQLKEKEFQAQYAEKLAEYDRFDSFLSAIAQNDPDLFKILQDQFAEHNKHFTNPEVDKVKSELAEIKKELTQFKSRASDDVTLAKLDSEWNSFMGSTGKEAEAAGVKIDRKALEDTWAAMPGQSLEAAFFAKYGKAMIAATVSKTKLQTAEKKVQAQPKVSTAGSVKRSTVPTTKDYKSMSWDEAFAYEMRQVLGLGKSS
jgi:hypothetical protein